MDEINYEEVPGTWAHELKNHWDAFDNICKIMNDKGNEDKVDYFKWREYVLWDMQRRHNEEVNGKK